MFHVCVEKIDVTDTVGNFLGTKQGLSGREPGKMGTAAGGDWIGSRGNH